MEAVEREIQTWLESILKAGAEIDYEEVFSSKDGEPVDEKLYERVKADARDKFDVYPSAVANGWVVQEYKRRGGKYRKPVSKDANESLADILRHDEGHDRWHAMHGDPPCKSEADCARMRARYAEVKAEREAKVSKAGTFTAPADVREAAARALVWIKEGRAGSGFTAVGRKRASDLANGHPLSLDTVKRMKAYFDRHQPDRDADGFQSTTDPTPGRVAWDAWGGTPGWEWAKGVVRDAEKE